MDCLLMISMDKIMGGKVDHCLEQKEDGSVK